MSTEIPTVLLVDDDSNFRASIKRSLRNEPFRVVTAESAVDALEILTVLEPQVIVSDLCMPTIDGNELLSYFKENHPAIVRIMLSGKFQVQDVIMAVNSNNVFRCLSKPCSAEDLSATLKEALLYNRVNQEKEDEIKRIKLQNILTDCIEDHTETRTNTAIVIDNETIISGDCKEDFSLLIDRAMQEVEKIDEQLRRHKKK